MLDMRRLYAEAPSPPRVRIVFGADYWEDRVQAEHMGDLPCVTLQPLDRFDRHNAITELIIRGQFKELLDWFLSGRHSTMSLAAAAMPLRYGT